MTNKPPRPHQSDDSIREAATSSYRDSLQKWADERGILMTDEEFACIVLAVMDMDDSFSAAKYVAPATGFPIDYAFVNILQRIYMSLQTQVDYATHEWVTQNVVRFPAKEGQGVRYLVDGTEYIGRVVGVVQRLAQGYVNAIGSKPGSSASHTKIDAENIIEVVAISNASAPTETPPDGGTPVAVAA